MDVSQKYHNDFHNILKIDYENNDDTAIIKIQSFYRYYRVHKITKQLQDGMTLSLLNKYIDNYIYYYNGILKIIKQIDGNGKCRMPQFPSYISNLEFHKRRFTNKNS